MYLEQGHGSVLAIAATANVARVPLITHDAADFRVIEDLVFVQSP